MGVEEEFLLLDRNDSWPAIFRQIRTESEARRDLTTKDSHRPEFRGRNRYRDVNPYDHSRVRIRSHNIDYINASLVESPSANRAYILTQGPLQDTCGHFWMMVWEQDSKAILMLNKLVEKDQIKCHQYYPVGVKYGGEDVMEFEDVYLRVTFIANIESNAQYTARLLRIEATQTHEVKEVTQFHYTAWPDFGVPESPSAFLDFLFAVRASGALDASVGPAVIHCSAGIGRSGTFCLVDTCLILIENGEESEDINVRSILLEMRTYRMGLIQTADQLRFSYLAIVEGAKRVMVSDGNPSIAVSCERQKGLKDSTDGRLHARPVNGGSTCNNNDGGLLDDDMTWPLAPPPLPPPRLERAVPHVLPTEKESRDLWKKHNVSIGGDEPTILPCEQDAVPGRPRRRSPDQRAKSAEEDLRRMKENQINYGLSVRPPRFNRLAPTRFQIIGLTAFAAAFGGYVLYRIFRT